MLRSILVLSLLVAVCGCEVYSQNAILPAILPDAPLTQEQLDAIAREDAESCNCGKNVEVEVSNSDS